MVIDRKPCSIKQNPMGTVTRVSVDIAKSIFTYMPLIYSVNYNGEVSIENQMVRSNK
jgi:hypothetical protein